MLYAIQRFYEFNRFFESEKQVIQAQPTTVVFFDIHSYIPYETIRNF